MTIPAFTDPDDLYNLALLRTPLGQVWSGRARYAAAMHFYRRELLSAEALEVYRIVSRLDHESPMGRLRDIGAASGWLEPLPEAEKAATAGTD